MLSFPADCTTPADRTEYAYRAQELLRLKHNQMGKRFREGKFTKAAWDNFLTKFFEPASNEIVGAILEARSSLKQSMRWQINIEVLF